MERFLWVCLGGALGTGARYLIGLWAGERLGAGFPYATLLVNTVGCFAIALVMQVPATVGPFSPTLRIAVTTGVLGGFTTYSSFNHETTTLLAHGARSAALLNIAATIAGCFVAGLLGIALGRRLFGS